MNETISDLIWDLWETYDSGDPETEWDGAYGLDDETQTQMDIRRGEVKKEIFQKFQSLGVPQDFVKKEIFGPIEYGKEHAIMGDREISVFVNDIIKKVKKFIKKK